MHNSKCNSNSNLQAFEAQAEVHARKLQKRKLAGTHEGVWLDRLANSRQSDSSSSAHGHRYGQGLKIIGTRFAYDSRKWKARFVIQDVRRGGVSPEHWVLTPSLVSLRAGLVAAARARTGATVLDISGAFLYSALLEEERVAVRPPPGHGDKNEAWFLQPLRFEGRAQPVGSTLGHHAAGARAGEVGCGPGRFL